MLSPLQPNLPHYCGECFYLDTPIIDVVAKMGYPMPDWKEDRQKKVVEASDGAGEEDSGGEAGDNEAEGQVGRDKAEGNVTVERPEVASVRAAAEDGTTSVGAEVEQ